MHALPVRAPLHATSALFACLLDWASYALSASHAPAMFPAIALGTALLTALSVLIIELHDTRLPRPVARAALTGLAAAVPLPMLGTALAMLCFGLARYERVSLRA